MATTIQSNTESMAVRLLRSMYIRGEFHTAGTVVTVNKRDGREMIYQERAAPFVEQPAAPDAPAPQVVTTDSAPAPSLTAQGGDTTPAPAAEPVKAKRTRKPKAEPAPSETDNAGASV